jgi:fido (protein-threonine AMPylation protein)
MSLTDIEIEFLTQSNFIEGEDDNIDQAALAWEFVKMQKYLTNQVIRKAHKVLMIDKKYPPPRGYYRDVPQINVTVGGRSGVDHSRVKLAMDDWLEHYLEWGWKEAHIKFEKIHPFADGNGRIGRILMNWQRLKENLPILVIHEGQEQQDYYQWFRTSNYSTL